MLLFEDIQSVDFFGDDARFFIKISPINLPTKLRQGLQAEYGENFDDNCVRICVEYINSESIMQVDEADFLHQVYYEDVVKDEQFWLLYVLNETEIHSAFQMCIKALNDIYLKKWR